MGHREATLASLRRRLAGETEESLGEVFGELRPEAIAALTRDLSDAEVEQVFEMLRVEAPAVAAEVLPLLDRHDVSRVLNTLEDEQVADVVEELSSDDATYVLELLHDDRVDSVVAAMEQPESREAAERLDYPEGSAGRIMSDEFVAMPAEATAGDAVRRLQSAEEDVTIVYVYLVDAQGRLVGVVSLRSLLRVKPDRRLAELTPSDVVTVDVHEDQEHVAQVMAQNDFVCIPVVDEQHRLVGVVTHDDVLDVLREEATEDMLHMAGTTADDVISQSVWNSARLRMPWLLFCLAGEMVALKVIHAAEVRLANLFVVLALFMPAISAMCGNVGMQSATIVVRGLATGRVRPHDTLPVFWHEFRTALLVAGLYGVLLGLLSLLLLDESPAFSLVVALGLVVSMAIASAFGTLVPILFHSMRIDPAVATGPLVTTSMDVLAFGTYFTLAGWLLIR